MMWFYGGGWWAMMFMWLIPVALVVWLVWALMGRSAGTPGRRPEDETDRAEAIARERFARGEIDEEELDRIVQRLKS